MYATLTPAYGCDYKTKKAVMEDWKSGKDFVLQDISSRYDGKYFNKESLQNSEYTAANIRYSMLRKITVVQKGK